jgi:hypothetical protein
MYEIFYLGYAAVQTKPMLNSHDLLPPAPRKRKA